MRYLIRILFLFLLILLPFPPVKAQEIVEPAAAAVQKPTLLWHAGGCSGIYCQTGWYSSPAVTNMDSDPQAEVIGAAYSIYVLDGVTGAVQAQVKSGHDITQPTAADVGRTWPDVALANLDGVGSLEIVTAHSDGWVTAYAHNLTFFPGWPKHSTPGSELRSLAVSDLDHNGDAEILVAATRSENQWYAYEHTGALRVSYWPQHSPDSNTNGYTAGCYNQNLAAGDLDNDGKDEIIGPNDTHYIAAFQDTGQQVLANTMFGLINGSAKVWSRVGVHVSQAVDLRGYANCGVEHRPNFANSAPVIADVDGSGTLEAIVIGNVYNCGTDPYTDLYEIPYIFNADRSRWHNSLFDWTVLPAPEPGAAPLSEDYHLIESSRPNPSVADLDNDGNLEIIYPSYDGRVHVYWLDKTEHGSWPYSVKKANEGFIRFASEAVVADLNADGQAEVIFASWTQKGSHQTGKLHILSSLGVPLWEVDLPAALGGEDWNGALAAPTLANIDLDPDLEVILNTANSGLVAYNLPGTSTARVLWGTGRGSYLRSGSLQHGYASHLSMRVNNPASQPGETLTYTIVLHSLGKGVTNAVFSNPIPASLVFSGGLAPASAKYLNGTVTWTGNIPVGQPVTIIYHAKVAGTITTPTQIINTAQLNDGLGAPLQISATTTTNLTPFFLPYMAR
jgi:uncharacterized repeat protein (TIGR01451 family)